MKSYAAIIIIIIKRNTEDCVGMLRNLAVTWSSKRVIQSHDVKCQTALLSLEQISISFQNTIAKWKMPAYAF